MGGTKSEVIQLPTTPAPNPSETSAQSLQAQLQYNPQLYEQYAQMYQQYMPQLAATDVSLQQQYAPLMQALQQQMYPEQGKLVEALAGQALGMMGSQQYATPEQQAAVDAIRQRESNRLSQSMRSRANLGGNLYSGNAQQMESRAQQELSQGYAAQDIDRLRQQQQMALQYAAPIAQIMYPQIQQPQMPTYTQPVVPSADTLYNAYYGASQPNYLYQQGSQSPLWGLAGSVAGGISGGWANNFFKK